MKFDLELLARCTGELIGTAIFVSIGCLGCASSNSYHLQSYYMVALSFGWAMAAAVQTASYLSGSHLNPTVSIACFMSGRMKWDEMLVYCLMQFFGSICGYGMLIIALPPELSKGEGFCVTYVHDSIDMWQGFAIEFILTSILVYFCCSIWEDRKGLPPDSTPVRFGLLLTGLTFSGGHYTGASMNLARSLAPTIFIGIWKHIWLYAASQFLAAIIVPLAWKYLHPHVSTGVILPQENPKPAPQAQHQQSPNVPERF